MSLASGAVLTGVAGAGVLLIIVALTENCRAMLVSMYGLIISSGDSVMCDDSHLKTTGFLAPNMEDILSYLRALRSWGCLWGMLKPNQIVFIILQIKLFVYIGICISYIKKWISVSSALLSFTTKLRLSKLLFIYNRQENNNMKKTI